jgi:hypothetical protein
MDTNTSSINTSVVPNESNLPRFLPDSKDLIILILILVLIFAVLGINFFNLIGNFIQYIVGLFKPLLSAVGYTTGSVINTTADLATDTTKFGIDVVGGSAKDVGNLFLAASDKRDIPNYVPAAKTYSSAVFNSIGTTLALHPALRENPPNNYLDKHLEHGCPSSTDVSVNVPSADTTINPIQNPISANKNKWCLVGEFQGKTGCVEVEDSEKCMSGQLFPSQQMCMK